MRYVVGIDIGTSGCKTIVLDEKGVVAGSASKEYYAKIGRDGSATQNPNDWYQTFICTLHKICEEFKIPLKDIVAISATGQMQGCTFIGKDGKAVRDSLLWYDSSPEKEVARFCSDYKELFLADCNMVPTTSLTGSKISYVINHESDIWKSVDKFVFASNYITYRLTGRLSVDTNNLGLSGLNSVADNNWSERLMKVTGITKDKVPELTGCFDVVGKVSKKAAKETGLTEDVIVVAGGGDGSTECYSIGIAGKSELKVRLGSAEDVAAVIHQEHFRKGALEGMRYVEPDYMLVGNYTKSCAISVKWARDLFFSELPKDSSSYSKMDTMIKNSGPGTNGLMFHPYLTGENAPYFNSGLRAKYTGINMVHDRGDFLKAVYEGISFSIKDLIDSIPAIKNLETIVIVGGGSKSKTWVQALTNILGKKALLPEYCDAAYGVGLMAGEVSGLFDGKEIVRRSRKLWQQIEYDKQDHQKYEELSQHYRQIALL